MSLFMLPAMFMVGGLALAWLFCFVWTRLFPHGMSITEVADQLIVSYATTCLGAGWLLYELHYAFSNPVRWIGVYGALVIFLCALFIAGQLRQIVKGEIDEDSIC